MTTNESNLVLCYNKGCCQQFDPDSNKEDSCIYHSGQPVFHDAYKRWSCCDMKSTDFSQFLNFKGCTKGFHSNVKPNLEKPKDIVKEYEAPPKPKSVVLKRPSSVEPLEKLSITIGASLKSFLDQYGQVSLEKSKTSEVVNKEVPPGTCCKNPGCNTVYPSEDECFYHPGVAVFHEGMKYWTCCMRKTSDFDKFLSQQSCTYGEHTWFKKATEPCRYDWHQTGSHVVVSIYAKNSIPDLSSVELNAIQLRVRLVYGKDQTPFSLDLALFGIVDPNKSRVTFFGSKVEIELKKAELCAWKTLNLKKEDDISSQMSDIIIN